MSTYTVYIDFGGTSGEVDISSLVRAITPTQRICTDSYRRATDQCSLTLCYDIDLMASLTSATSEVTVRVLKDGNAFFYGRIPPTESFESAGSSGGADPDISDLELEVTDFGNKLEREISADDAIAWENLPVCDPSVPGASIVHKLFALCGLTLNTTIEEPTVLRGFARDDGTVASALDTLLYEYGLVAYQRESGEWDLYRWIEDAPEATETLDASNLMASLKVERVEREADAAKVVWYGLKEKTQALVYMADLPFDDKNKRSGYPVQAGLLWPEEANIGDTWFDYQDTSLAKTLSESGQRIISNKDFTQILLTSNHTLDVHIDSGLTPSFTPIYQNKRARIAYYNPTAGPLNIYYCDIYADVVYRAAANEVVKNAVISPVKTNSYEAEFIHDAESASRLACAMADLLYGKSVWRYTFPSEDRLTLGVVATLTDPYSGLSTTVRIVERSYDPETEIYTYKAISIKPVVFTPSASQTSLIPTTPKTKEEDASQQTQKIADDLYAYLNDIPPSNNPTELSFSYEKNGDGSVDVLFSFKHIHGSSKASGFWVFYLDDIDAPDAIDISSSPKITISAQKSDTEVTYSGKISAIAVRYGGVGAVTKHYRFGVVAFGLRKSGTVPYVNNDDDVEVVENADWIDKTFEAQVDAVEGNIRMSFEGASLVHRLISTGEEVSRVRYDELVNLLKISALAAEVEFECPWTFGGTWGSAVTITSAPISWPSTIKKSDDTVMCAYFNDTTEKLVYKMRSVSGVWDASESVITSYPCWPCAIEELNDGSVLCVYKRYSNGYLCYRIIATDGTIGPEQVVCAYAVSTLDILKLSDGSVLCAYVVLSTTYLMERVFSTEKVWGVENPINEGVSGVPILELLEDGTVYCAYSASGYLVGRIRSVSGVWASAESITNTYNLYYNPGLKLLPNQNLMCAYRRASDGYLVYKIRSSGVWGSESVINAAASLSPDILVLASGALLCVYLGSSNIYERVDNSAFGSLPNGVQYKKVGSGIVKAKYNASTDKTSIEFGCGIVIEWNGDTLTKNIPTISQAAITAGDYSYEIIDSQTAHANTSFTKVYEVKINEAGTYRVQFDLRGTTQVRGRIYKNGSAIGTERICTTTYTRYTQDFTFASGDLVQLYTKADNSGYTVLSKNFGIGWNRYGINMTLIPTGA